MHIHRAEVLGSMLRPEYLKRAREAFAAGTMTAAEFKRAEDRAVDQAIAAQEGAGLDIVTDGEMRRHTFISPIYDAVSGIERTVATRRLSGGVRWHRGDEVVDDDLGVVVTAPIARRRSLAAEEYSYARARARTAVKVTLPAPALAVVAYAPDRAPQEYRDPTNLIADAAKVVRAEIEELVKLGCTEIQIDSPHLSRFCDPDQFTDWSKDAEATLIRQLEALDQLVAGIPGVTFSLHLCRGNNKGMWHSKGGYDRIARELFNRVENYDRFMLEYDNDRSGSFEPLAAAPDDKALVLGLVSTKTSELEPHARVVARVREAARYFPLEQMAVSTQCGFASDAEGNPLSEEDQERKLVLVSNVADEVWG
jgi:5-methyltetrahydropteroyltriglutamate--homocysteine methyltransferase